MSSLSDYTKKCLKLAKNFAMLSFTLVFFCTNCYHHAKKIGVEDSGFREIDIMANLSNNRAVKLSDIASSIEYCMLETDKKCLVAGNIIYCSKDFVVTFGGGMSDPAFYVFERKSGHFVRKISRYGRGPGEYTEPVYSFWDENREQVCAFGNNQHLFFNLDGTISHQANRFNHWMDGFISHEDFYVGYIPNRFGDATIRIAFYDKRGNLVDSIPNYRSWKRTQTWYTGGGDNWLYVFNNNLYFKELYCDTLYHIKDFTLHPRYMFNTGGRAVPYDIQEGGRYNIMEALRNQGIVEDRYERYVCILQIFEDNKYLYFKIEYRKQLYPAIYDKAEDNLHVMSPIDIPPLQRGSDFRRLLYGFENDLDGGLPFWPQQMISDKEMMCVYSAEELLGLDLAKITDSKLKKVLHNLEEDSNPVVAIVTLKE